MAKFDVNAAAASVKVNTAGSGRVYMKEMLDTSTKVVKIISLDLIDDFKGHPFSVKDDVEMEQLVQSVKQCGVLTPILVREKEGGRYEAISGHRRRRACALAGIAEIPTIIEEMTDEKATVRMVDANLQREKILPSEKAFAYKIKLEALKKEGGQSGHKLRDLIGDGESGRTVQRYLAITRLIPEMLELIDTEKMPLSVGVILSSMPQECQNVLLELCKEKMPTTYMATELKELPKMNIFTEENIKRILYGMPKRAPSTPQKQEDEDIKARLENVLNKYEKESDRDMLEIEQKDIFGNYVKVNKVATEPKEIKKVDKVATESKEIKKVDKVAADIPNWNGDDNQIMKGYILKAVDMWNSENLTDQITQKTLDKLLTALRWATDELTAEKAYRYYEKR